ncbi:transposase [Hydrogenibacillus schlegelii]|uniref:transposase n=1 Tax=Hydrogenibacillus schlegelii TaxID=1484 RepID=UPI0034A042F1
MKRTKSIPGSIKFKAALERIKGEKTLVELSREYGVHPNTLLKWKQTLLEKGADLFEHPTKELEYHKLIRDLELLLGKKEV